MRKGEMYIKGKWDTNLNTCKARLTNTLVKDTREACRRVKISKAQNNLRKKIVSEVPEDFELCGHFRQ